MRCLSVLSKTHCPDLAVLKSMMQLVNINLMKDGLILPVDGSTLSPCELM